MSSSTKNAGCLMTCATSNVVRVASRAQPRFSGCRAGNLATVGGATVVSVVAHGSWPGDLRCRFGESASSAGWSGGASRLRCLTPPSSNGVSGWVGVQLSSFHGALSSGGSFYYHSAMTASGVSPSPAAVGTGPGSELNPDPDQTEGAGESGGGAAEKKTRSRTPRHAAPRQPSNDGSPLFSPVGGVTGAALLGAALGRDFFPLPS